ncbi:phage baseplate protein [Streptomyces acidicola]|uniref:phage baseplate protein n=1 Tax=Streptomyces acidicola TaxID=2596892 RepID=UPI0038154B6F
MSEIIQSGKGNAVSRRTLLLTGAGIAAAASGGFSLLTAETAYADVDPSQYFVLEGNGGDPVVRRTLHQPYWAMQSFAFDHVHGHIYFVQTKVGSKTGDLWVTRTDLSGNVLGSMALHSFDHGSSMGVQPDTSGSPFIWLAGDYRSLKPDTDPNSHTICRIKYKDGGLIDYHTSPGVAEFKIGLSDFLDCPRPSIDPYTNRLLVRYMGTTSPWRLALFNLSDVIARGINDDTRPLAKRALPTNAQLGLSDSDLFQGVTSYGQYAYLSYGGAPAKPSDPAKPSYLVRLDMNQTGGQYNEKFQTTAGNSLPGREPQGMAIWRSSSGPRLAFGFSSKIAVSPDEFQSTVFYKSDLAG